MRRTCARPGCHEEATTTLSYDYGASTVVIEALLPDAHPMLHDLCDRHANRLSVPRGWLLRDQRPTAPNDVMGEAPFRRAVQSA
ncbi:MAG: DUF3499 family protein [Acidimicrobiales bacterium]